ncbi:efflux RND transporter periplasmic adaptor subunit [Fibrobacterota bacterium]
MKSTIIKITSLTITVMFFLLACSGPVRYQKVSLNGHAKTRTFSGVSKAGTEIKLSFKVGGTVKTVKVKVGDQVKKNGLIASLDKTDVQLRYDQAKVAASNARIQMQTAKSSFERAASLYETKNISLQDFEAARTGYESAKAAVSSREKELKLAGSQVNYTMLYAPMEGIVTRVKVEKNENVTPGKVVAELNSGNDIEVNIGIPESYISRIKKGEKVKVKFPSLPGRDFKGLISEVSYSISSESSTYPVCVKLTHPSDRIRPGMAADVTFRFASESGKTSLVVPASTVAEDQVGRFVFTVTENDSGLAIVHKKAVTTGDLTNEGLEIVSGLEDGDLVVTAGISKLTDGMKVKLLK